MKQKQNIARKKRANHRSDRQSTFDWEDLGFGKREKVFPEFQKLVFKCRADFERLRNTAYIIKYKEGKIQHDDIPDQKEIRIYPSQWFPKYCPWTIASASLGNIRNSSYQTAKDLLSPKLQKWSSAVYGFKALRVIILHA